MAVVFVGGHPRAGTTMAQQILTSAPGTNPLTGEVVFLRGYVETYWRSLGMFEEHSRFFFGSREELRAFCARHVSDFVEQARRHWGGPEHLVLKHPPLTPHFPLLAQLLPEARFVVVAREPKDTVASCLRAKARGADEFGTMGAPELARNIVNYYMPVFECPDRGFHGRTALVRYEDLVADPRRAATAVGGVVGLDLSGFDPDSDATDNAVDFSDRPDRLKPLDSAHYGKAITRARVGGYREILSAEEVSAVDGICAPYGKLAGYG